MSFSEILCKCVCAQTTETLHRRIHLNSYATCVLLPSLQLCHTHRVRLRAESPLMQPLQESNWEQSPVDESVSPSRDKKCQLIFSPAHMTLTYVWERKLEMLLIKWKMNHIVKERHFVLFWIDTDESLNKFKSCSAALKCKRTKQLYHKTCFSN